ncbi:hypothetical protein [Arthrobacter sp. NicSoilB8]|uniref:hypothetical protein n=1 Tax=Arthrobacter sp. NicSoilB8 TaxID=2830998 RepID=UPI001CC435A9|nr:hypothetical protein [Arthrobacter sp. NicSoilB8]BCW69401.1 hypothetical protein NicSoilB8_04450 [Arthrobacter sp. NicSoilB8]
MSLTGVSVPTGILFPQSLLDSEWFAILATFVAINTVMYAALAAVKVLPKLHRPGWLRTRQERGETRSIHPDAPR